MRGQQIQDNTIGKDKLNLIAPVVGKDPVTKTHFDLNVNRKISSGTLSDFQNWFDTNISSFYVTDPQIAGLFTYDATSVRTADNAMTIIKDSKKYVRNYNGFVSVNWFGAKPDGVLQDNVWVGTDNTVAIQKALDWVNDRGLAILLEEGNYLVSNSLKPKKVNNKSDFRLSFVGKGKGVSFIRGVGNTLSGKSLFDATFKTGDTEGWFDSSLLLRDLTFVAGKADKCLHADRIIQFDINSCTFLGGEVSCIDVGDEEGNTFGVSIKNCYFNTSTINGGQNTSLMKVRARYAEIRDNMGDGGYHAIDCGVEQLYIAGNTFEGFKHSGIFASITGGGKSKIIGNSLRPYSGYDPNGLFDGQMHGIYINSISGGAQSNTIVGNVISTPTSLEIEKLVMVSNITGGLISTGGYLSHELTGGTSGAKGYLFGRNSNRLQLFVNSGTFVTGETVTQGTTGGSFVITSFVPVFTTNIKLVGVGGYNTVIGNSFDGGDYAMHISSPGNLISSNFIASPRNGILVDNDTSIVGNRISLYGGGAHIAVKRTAGVVKWEANDYNGTLEGIAPQALSKLTTIQRNAAVQETGNLTYNTDLNKFEYYNGAAYFQLLANDRFIPKLSTNLRNATSGGVHYHGTEATNTMTPYATVLTVNGNTETGEGNLGNEWVNQLIFGTNRELFFNQKITYTDWTSQRIWTSLYIMPSQSNVATSAGVPTQAEFNALVTSYNNLLAKMRTAGLLTA